MAIASTQVNVNDGLSGVNTVQHLWSTSTVEPTSGWETFVNGATLTYAFDGTYYLWIRATDNSGNIVTSRSNAL